MDLSPGRTVGSISLGALVLLLLAYPAVALAGIDAGGAWEYDLYMGGDRVGTCLVTSTSASDGELETRAEIRFELRRSGQTIGVEIDGRTSYAWPGGRPRDYDLKIVPTVGPPTGITATFGDGESTITLDIAGQTYPNTVETRGDEFILDNNFLVDHYLVMLASVAPREGEKVEIRFVVPQIVANLPKVFSSTLTGGGRETLELGGVEREALKLSAVGDTGLKMEFWLDPADRTLLRWTVPSQGTEVLLSTGEETETSPADLDRMLAKVLEKYYIPAYLEMGRFQDVERLEAKVKLCASTGCGFPTDAPWQTFDGSAEERGVVTCLDGVFRTQMDTYDGEESLPLDAPASGEEAAWLETTPNVPATAPEVIAVAKEAAKGAATRWQAAAAVARWVHDHVKYEITGAGALDCLEKRRGDCGPQSLLSLAMMRSLGVPARLAGGLLYVGGKFGQHNWVEVRVAPGRWVPVDPTTGEIGRFSASHVSLWRGPGALAPDAGPMDIDILAFRKAADERPRGD